MSSQKRAVKRHSSHRHETVSGSPSKTLKRKRDEVGQGDSGRGGHKARKRTQETNATKRGDEKDEEEVVKYYHNPQSKKLIAWEKSARRFDDLNTTGYFSDYPKGLWVAFDFEMGVIATGEHEAVVQVVDDLRRKKAVTHPTIRQIGYPVPRSYYTKKCSKAVAGKEDLGAPPAAVGLDVVFRHTKDDRGWVKHGVQYRRHGKFQKRTSLLDWGADTSWILSSGSATFDHEIDMFLGGDVPTRVPGYRVAFRAFGLSSRVVAAEGDRIIGSDVLKRYNHTINPPDDGDRQNHVGWWQIVPRANQQASLL